MPKRRLSSYYGMFATYGNMLERLYTRRKWRKEMLNVEKYKDEIKTELEKDETLGCVVNKLMGNKCDYYPKCNECYLKVFDWLLEEYKEPLLSDEGIDYLMTLILPYSLIELDSVIKINLGDELKYKLCVHLKDCVITVYFQRGTELCQWFDNLENGKYYNAKELGLC